MTDIISGMYFITGIFDPKVGRNNLGGPERKSVDRKSLRTRRRFRLDNEKNPSRRSHPRRTGCCEKITRGRDRRPDG